MATATEQPVKLIVYNQIYEFFALNITTLKKGGKHEYKEKISYLLGLLMLSQV